MSNNKPARPLWAENADIALRRRRMTQKDLAEKLGLARGTVNTALSKGSCSDDTRKLICNFLGV